ncbi:MAG: hypothetical protein RR472_05240, partial [Anaerovoracaceae bacterium]
MLRKAITNGFKARATIGKKIQKQQKAMTTRYLLVLGVFSFVLLYSLVNDFRTMPEVVKDEQQRITAVQRPKEEALPLVLDAKVWAVNEELKVSKEAQLVIDAQNKEGQREEPVRSETESQKLERKIGSAIRSLNQDTKTEKVILPKALADGTKLIWQEKKQGNYPMVILGGMLTLFVIYKSRFDGIKKEEGRARESVIKELPEFLNKLVLLLSSGMVLQGAFERIMEDYGRMEGGKPSYFYGQLHEVYVKTKETNAIFQEEFRSFARRSQVRELMR